MAPVVDLANHSGRVTSDMSYAYFRDAFVLTLGGDVAAGDQVYISYGAQGNDSLLQWYGFCEKGNPHDAYRLVWTPPPSSSSSSTPSSSLTTTLTRAGATADDVAAVQAALGGGATRGRALAAIAAAIDAELDRWARADAGRAPAVGRRAELAAAFRAEKRAVLGAAAKGVAKAVAKEGRV